MITQSGIEAFLAICRKKNITKAAESLFICQSSLSVRLKSLECELGTTLFLRQKGQREIILTQSGKEFYKIATEYEQVMNKIDNMRLSQRKKLVISSINSLGSYILPEGYEQFLYKNPDIELIIQDYDFNEACKNILQGTTDIAFNTDNTVSDKISALPIFFEPFTIICSKSSQYPQSVCIKDLSVKNEVFVDWFNGFEAWHQSTFGEEHFPQIRLNIMSQLKLFVKKRENWAIVPISVALGLLESPDIKILNATFPLPERTVYCLYSSEKGITENHLRFLECLDTVISSRKEIRSLLSFPLQ